MGERLREKVCLITGSGGSMGRSAARLFAAEGAIVIGCDINASAAKDTCQEVIQAGGNMTSIHPVDLSDPDGARKLAEDAMALHGRIDVLYNNGAAAEMAWIEDMTPQQWSSTISNELDIVFFLSQAVWPHFVTAGGGSIVNVGSVSGKRAYKVLPGAAHSAAKGGVLALTRQLAMEGGPHNIRVNSISPGLVMNGAIEELMKDKNFSEAMLDKIMLGRPGEPEDVIPAAIYLASDESRWVTGADFAIDGGTTAW